jgi:hypothetical protein
VDTTVGKEYTIIEQAEYAYNIEDDVGDTVWVSKDMFEPIQDSDEPKQFRELSELDQMCLFQAWLRGSVIEVYITELVKWRGISLPNWNKSAAYRVKPKELTKPSIDWSHVHEDYKWMATDADGETYLFESEPILRISVWGNNEVVFSVKAMTSYTEGTCDWTDSLVRRG